MLYLQSVLLQMNQSPMMDGWGGGFGMVMMVLFWLLILALIVSLIWFLIRKARDTTQDVGRESPLDILKKRYARGEIDEDEFRRKRKEIIE